MSENETPPWSPEKGALWRLEQWRDGGECPVGYTAGNVGFAEDVKAVMSVFDDAVRGLTDASRLISIADAEVEALKHDNSRLMDSLNGEMRARVAAEEEIKALKAQREEVAQNGAAIMRSTCAMIADSEAQPDADDHLIDPEWVKGYGAAARSIARSIRALPVPPTSADRRVTRMTLEEIKALPLNVDWEKIRSTTEEDIERMRQEDDQ